MASEVIWTTKSVLSIIKKLRQGADVDLGCFHNRNPELKASNILFQLTHEEEQEFIKCSSDITYFVETYCRFLTDAGRTTVDLRYFQEDILDTLGEEEWIPLLKDVGPTVRNFILMASRQTGKCFSFDAQIVIRVISTKGLTNEEFKITIGELYDVVNKQNKKSLKQKIIQNIKTFLMNIYKNLNKHIILFLIQALERWEFSGLDLDESDISKKIIETIPLEDLEIETDSGFKPISSIHKTQPYTIWRIDLENGLWLEGADNHILFDQFMNQIFVKNLNINDSVQTKYGLSKVIKKQRFNQKISMFDVTVDSAEHRFYSNNILSHNTTTIAAYFAWYMCFHTDRNLAILANKQQTTFEIVNKVTDVFKGLPFFLKPGIESIGAGFMRLDNGCMLTSQATTKTAAIGFAIHVLYIDEFAHIQQNIARDFWRSVYPTLSSSLISQCIISSTPYGQDNLFFEIWDKAVKGQNSFVWKQVNYWEVPGHDDNWAAKMRRDFGDNEFAQEYELKFDIKTNNLLEGSQLNWLKRLSQVYSYEYKELEKTNLDSELYENLQWRTDFDPNKDINNKTDRFVISIDLAEGKDVDEKKDSDYNIAAIHQVKLKSLVQLRKLRRDEQRIENMFRLEQIGLYRDNVKDENILAKVTKAIVFDQFNDETCKLVVEMNFNGKVYLAEFSNHEKFNDNIVMNSHHTAPIPGEKPPRKKPGFKVRADKEYFSKLGKKLIGQKTLVPTHEETYHEFNAFGKDKEGKYKGIARHDDTVMAELNLARLYAEPEYGDWLYDFLDEMPDCKEKKYALEILKEPYDETEISDELFSSMFNDEDPKNKIEEIFKVNSQQHFKYRPGKTF